MNIVFILGPQAVGKMTIGEALSKKIDTPLLFNHMTLDIISPFLGWTADTFRISQNLRNEILEAVAKDSLNKGLIMTFCFFFDEKNDWLAFEKYKNNFESRGIEVCIVELETTLEERLKRNKSENRLLKKPSKRDLEYSENELRHTNEKHRLNSNPGEIKDKNYFRLDVTNLTPNEAADKIINRFNLNKKMNE